MCGVFGWVAKGEGKLNLKTLRAIALASESRGRHAWGVSWLDAAGVLRSYKQAGAIGDSLAALQMVRGARMVIGHTRWATQGSPADNVNNHPHASDGGWLVHNGVIPHYRQLLTEYGLHASTDCDSEVLGLLIESQPGALLDRCLGAANIAGVTPLVILGLWKPGRLVAVRKGNPLHAGRSPGGTYLASLPQGLPHAVEVPDNTGRVFLAGGG